MFFLIEFVSPSIMLPPGRLSNLLDQVVIAQREKCIYHEEDVCLPNLLEDHYCERSKIPLRHTIPMNSHEDEVWCLSFSNSGAFLASGSKDSTVIIWHTGTKDTNEVCCLFCHIFVFLLLTYFCQS